MTPAERLAAHRKTCRICRLDDGFHMCAEASRLLVATLLDEPPITCYVDGCVAEEPAAETCKHGSEKRTA